MIEHDFGLSQPSSSPACESSIGRCLPSSHVCGRVALPHAMRDAMMHTARCSQQIAYITLRISRRSPDNRLSHHLPTACTVSTTLLSALSTLSASPQSPVFLRTVLSAHMRRRGPLFATERRSTKPLWQRVRPREFLQVDCTLTCTSHLRRLHERACRAFHHRHRLPK